MKTICVPSDHPASTCFTDVVCRWILQTESLPKPSQSCFLPDIQVQVDLSFMSLQNSYHESNLTFLFIWQTNSWLLRSLHFMIELDNEKHSSLRVFFAWVDIIKGFSLPWKRSCDHPLLPWSVDVQAFSCCSELTTAKIFFPLTINVPTVRVLALGASLIGCCCPPAIIYTCKYHIKYQTIIYTYSWLI